MCAGPPLLSSEAWIRISDDSGGCTPALRLDLLATILVGRSRQKNSGENRRTAGESFSHPPLFAITRGGLVPRLMLVHSSTQLLRTGVPEWIKHMRNAPAYASAAIFT
jgi:hypothetical protein